MVENADTKFKLFEIDNKLYGNISDSKNIIDLKKCAKTILKMPIETREGLELSISKLKIRSSSLLLALASKYHDSYDYNELHELIDCCGVLKELKVSIDIPLEVIIQTIMYQFEIEYKIISNNPEKTKNIQSSHLIINHFKNLMNSSSTKLLAELESFGKILEHLEPIDQTSKGCFEYKDNSGLDTTNSLCLKNKEEIHEKLHSPCKDITGAVVYYKNGEFRNKKVFIKEYKVNRQDNEKKKLEIENEIQCLVKISELKRKHFVKFYAYYKDDLTYTLVMKEYFRSLQDYINTKGKLDSEEFFELAEYLVEAFYTLQLNNIYHGDIKTANIMMNKKNKPIIIDFGVSTLKIEASENSFTLDQEFHGTREYLAPELLKAFSQNKSTTRYRKESSDVFSLGITFLKMLKGNNWKFNSDSDNGLKDELETLDKSCKEFISGMVETNPQERKTFSNLSSYFHKETI